MTSKDILKTYKDQHHLHWKPYPFKPNWLHMPHITELDLSKENKENIPPFMLCDNLSNLIDYFDNKFKDYESYFTYFHQQLPKWISKPTFKLFNAHSTPIPAPTKEGLRLPPATHPKNARQHQ